MNLNNIPRSFADLDEVEFTTPSKKDRFIQTRDKLEDLETDIQINTNSKNKLSNEENRDEGAIYRSILEVNLNQNSASKSKSPFDEMSFEPAKIRIPPISRFQERPIPKTPFKVLDAPNLVDDFYVNVIDWSNNNNNIGVGLGSACYIWSFNSNAVEKVTEFNEGTMLTSLTWEAKTDLLAIGSVNGDVELHDVVKKKCLRKIDFHTERVGTLSFMDNLLLSGSRDQQVLLFDVRSAKKPVKTYKDHTQEVCGLKWSPDGLYFASGGNDNMMYVYSPKTDLPLMKKQHKAAVRAIAWSERQYGVLASGAGTADRCIRLWNLNENKKIDMRDTESQVSNIIFSRKENEIITSHGFSKNDICIWKTKGLRKTHSLLGHASRVLHLAMSPCGNYIVSGAGDETLRFWSLNYTQKQDTPDKKDVAFNSFQINLLR